MLSLIPISDANPARRFPIVTIALIAVNVLVFFQEPDLGSGSLAASRYFYANAPIPCQLEDDCPSGLSTSVGGPVLEIPERGLGSFIAAILFSTFLHGGILHIAGNMLFLWIFGNNVEDFLGSAKYLLFYLAGGIVAAFAHVLTNLNSVVPAVGASGAVAAVMGAYLVLYPKARVNVLVPIIFLFTFVRMSAWAVLGIWFLYQFLIGAQAAAGATSVAWMAHVGGFLFGVVGVYLLGGRPQRPAGMLRPEWRY